MKPENILIDGQGHIRLTDFGLSKEGLHLDNNMTESFCGTTEYLAPEIIQSKQYGYSVDFYSFGLVLYEMLSGVNPYKSAEWMKMQLPQQINTILSKEIEMLPHFSAEAKNLLGQLLAKDVSQSLTICSLRNA